MGLYCINTRLIWCGLASKLYWLKLELIEGTSMVGIIALWSSLKVVLRLSTTFAPVLQHGRIATIVICLHTLRRASTRKLNRFWQNWHLQRWLIVKSKSKMASRPRQRPSTTEKPTMTFSIKPRLICIITKTTVASTNIALTIRVAVKCHRQRLFSRDTKWPKAKY